MKVVKEGEGCCLVAQVAGQPPPKVTFRVVGYCLVAQLAFQPNTKGNSFGEWVTVYLLAGWSAPHIR